MLDSGVFMWKSYLITEYVDGQRLSTFLRNSNIIDDTRSEVTQQINRLLDKLEKYRIIHSDLKHSNILISENTVVLTDLDAMKVYKWNWTYKLRRTRKTKRDSSRDKQNAYQSYS